MQCNDEVLILLPSCGGKSEKMKRINITDQEAFKENNLSLIS